MTYAKAIELLTAAGAELAEIHRAKEYSLWRGDAAGPLDEALAQTNPFKPYASAWLFTGDGGGRVIHGCFGDWAIDRLLSKVSPEGIIAELEAEAERNTAAYKEISPVLGIKIDRKCLLSEGVALLPGEEKLLWQSGIYMLPSPLLSPIIRGDPCVLCQTFSVRPAFEAREGVADSAKGESVTTPAVEARDRVRRTVRFACLLAGTGAVEIPTFTTVADKDSLFASSGTQRGNSLSSYPLVSLPVDVEIVKSNFDALGTFREKEKDSLCRAIDRLGRARLASSPVDKALELGIAAEIALMHGESSSNTEITYKIGSRAAWLLGKDPADRAEIFDEIRLLYQARSQAVHTGILSTKSKVDLEAGDRLVAQTLVAILARGSFPAWSRLTMGGDR